MKDVARSRKSIFKTFREGLIQKHPNVFNIILILALISLVIAGAFLLSDIMSNKSNAAQKGPYSALYLKIPQVSQTAVKNWQENGINLIDQLKSVLGMKGPAKVAGKDAAIKDKARALLAKNRLAKAKVARTKTENLSHLENPMGPSNSSRTLTTVQPLKAASAIMMGSSESEGSSDTSIYRGDDSSSKDIENNHQFGAVTSGVNENQPQSNKSVSNGSVSNESLLSGPIRNESVANESAIDESVSNDSVVNESVQNESILDESVTSESLLNEEVMNESVANESAIDESVSNDSVVNESVQNESILDESVTSESLLNEEVMNESVVNKSAIDESVSNDLVVNESVNSSINTSWSLPADHGSNGTVINSSYLLVSRDTNHSFDNLSSGLLALPESHMNFAASNSTEIHDSIAQDRNGSTASGPSEFSNMSNEIYNQNETSNLKTNNNSIQDRKAKNESQGTMLDQKDNLTSDALASSSNDIPPNSVPDKTSNITPGQIIKSLEGQSNSAPTGNSFLVPNSTSQLQEPKQNQTYNLNESEPRLDGSSMSLLPLPSNKTEEPQNPAEKNKNTEKKVSTSSGLAKSQESKKSQTGSVSRFRTLKVPTPSWITKAESKNKGKGA